jgi:hypothetical protein
MDPRVVERGGLPDVDVGELLDDELVGMDDTVDRQVGVATSNNERWTTGCLEKFAELRSVSETRRRKMRETGKSAYPLLVKKVLN